LHLNAEQAVTSHLFDAACLVGLEFTRDIPITGFTTEPYCYRFFINVGEELQI
jgi:hypothetical protein